MNKHRCCGFGWVVAALLPLFLAAQKPAVHAYPLHKNITATEFWVGEDAGPDNHHIANIQSAWDDHWMQHFGGVDDPKHRKQFLPADFAPKENPFYFALPYDDFVKGKRRADAERVVPWAGDKTWGAKDSMCKNRWIQIIRGDRACYAQWEDVGPFKTDDAAYVFGTAAPKSKSNRHAGLDLSPAVEDCLGLGGMDAVDWQFVEESDVPDGPWKKTITTSQISWE